MEAIALLYITKAFPFSSWHAQDIALSEDENRFFFKVCTTAQFSAFRNALENATDDEILSVTVTHAIFEIIARSEPSLRESLHYFFELDRSFLMTLVKMRLAGEASENIHPRQWLAGMWTKMEQESLGKSFQINEKQLDRLVSCMEFATNEASSYFNNLCKNITEYDLEKINDFYFSDKRAINEEVVFRKHDYLEVFQIDSITLGDLLNAQKRDRDAFRAAATKYQNMRNNVTQFLETDRDEKSTYDAFNNWLTEYDQLRAETFARGGECEDLLSDMNEFRSELKHHFDDAALQNGIHQEFFKLFQNLFKIGDDFYDHLTASKLGLQISFIENSKEIAPFIITSKNTELEKFRNAVDKDGSMGAILEEFVRDLFFKLKANSIEDGAEKLKFLFEKVKIVKGTQ